jgi:hypothetical protein
LRPMARRQACASPARDVPGYAASATYERTANTNIRNASSLAESKGLQVPAHLGSPAANARKESRSKRRSVPGPAPVDVCKNT